MIGADRPPVAAAGAIAASAVPTAAGIGAAAGATVGAIARMLRDHDVDDRNAEYYEERIERGGIFVAVELVLPEVQMRPQRPFLNAAADTVLTIQE